MFKLKLACDRHLENRYTCGHISVKYRPIFDEISFSV